MLHCKKPPDFHIEIIANTWLIVELSVFWIGVPMLPSSPERKKLKNSFYAPLNDFLRSSFVQIPTIKLEEIEKALKNNDNRDEINQLYHRIELSLFDRIYFPLISGGLIFILALGFIIPISSSITYSIYAACSSSLGAILASSLLSLERIRIEGLLYLIQNELKRRKGNMGSISGIPALI